MLSSSRRFFLFVPLVCFLLFSVPVRAAKIPDFRLPEVSSGKIIDTTNLRGQVVLINFWATWCGPCRKELPELDALYREYSGRGFTVIGISIDSVGRSRISAFVKGRGLSYPVVKGNSSLGRRYGGVSAIPASYLVGKDGEIIKKVRGYISGDRWRPYIDKALAR